LEWFDTSPLSIKAEDFPRAFYLTPFRWNDVKDIKITLSSMGVNKTIYSFNHSEDQLFADKLLFTWKHSPGKGESILTAILTDNFGKTVEKTLVVNIE